MSKAFNTVNRKILFEKLNKILERDKLEVLSTLTNQPEIKVKIEESIAESFKTYAGIMQGDCPSAILFAF